MEINPAAIYSCDDVRDSSDYPKGFSKRLKAAGFLRSKTKICYYHPTHWKYYEMGKLPMPADINKCYWLFDDTFEALSPEALAFLKDDE